MRSTASGFTAVGQSDDILSSSCSEEVHVREPPARAHGSIRRVAPAAVALALVTVAGVSWTHMQEEEEVGDQMTGLADAAYGAYTAIGCSNWNTLEISRKQTLTKAACETACNTDSDCTMYNWQATACEPGWLMANGCLLFRGECETESNPCWELNYKISKTFTTVTQALGFTVQDSTDGIDKAVTDTLADKGVSPTTATISRRLMERSLASAVTVTWKFQSSDKVAADNAAAYGTKLWNEAAERVSFVETLKTNLPAGTELSTDTMTAAEPTVNTEGGTTTESPVVTTPAA